MLPWARVRDDARVLYEDDAKLEKESVVCCRFRICFSGPRLSCWTTYFLLNNTLENNGCWTSTKECLEDYANGSSSFMRGTQALAGRRLNLGAWLGYQEILSEVQVSC